MSNILIIASSDVSKRFIEQLEIKNLKIHNYTIIYQNENIEVNNSKYFNYIKADATSLYRLKKVCLNANFTQVYILSDIMEESLQIYNNIRALNKKIRIIALDYDHIFRDIEDINLSSVDVNGIISNRLYDFLPNVPVTAQTIGLNEGEIMEVVVPFSSSYAFRHISSIPQIKWKIAAIYRDDKLLLPNNATMLKPRDRLVIIGKPKVLSSVYSRINSKNNIFPEPFGKNFYLCVDIDKDGSKVIDYIQEAIFILDKFENKELIIRVLNPNNFEIAEKIKKYETRYIKTIFTYNQINEGDIATDIEKYDIGLILISNTNLKFSSFSKELYAYKKLIYIFGESRLQQIKEATVVKSDDRELEEISSVAFYIAETLKVPLSLREYDPNEEYNSSNDVIEHYETLSRVHNIKFSVIQKRKNPIKAIKKLENILLIIPFSKDITFNGIKSYLSRDVDSLLLKIDKHPKLLISVNE